MPANALINSLKKRSEFLFVAQGNKASGRFLSLQARKNDSTPEIIKYGLTASKKVGNAVKRNRAKRRLRVALNNILSKAGKTGFDYVAIARPQTIDANWQALLDEVDFLVKRLSNTNLNSKANKRASNAT